MASNTISILIRAQGAAQAEAEVDKAGRGVERAADRMKDAAKLAAAATAVAAVAITKDAVSSAGNYESSLSKLQYATNATEKQMKQLGSAAMDLGRDNTLAGVSAADAAATMTELAKAGLSVDDTLAAAKGTMSLAKAGNIEFAEAAVIAASSLNAFNMEGSQAGQVADTLAAGANASQANLSDLALGLQQSATVAKQFKLSLNENVTALSLFANNGIKGSDAGTSLKTMLISLAKPSADSASAMKEIGFNAYNAQGEFVGLREMSARLQRSLKGLTDEQKQNVLATIFGTDAFRAAAVLADNSGKSYDRMSKAVGRNGAAQDAAKAQMGAYDRSIEKLKNTVDELSIRFGTALLPAATQMANFLSGNATPAFDKMGQIVTGQVPAFNGLAAATIVYGAATTGATTVVKLATAAQLLFNNAVKAHPLALVVAGAVGIVAAYASVVSQTDRATTAEEMLKAARDRQRAAAQAVKDSEIALKNERLGAEGATLRVERAQRAYNEAVRQYGPKSLEAREAAYNLRTANDQLKDANNRVTEAERRKQEKEGENRKVATTVKAAEMMKQVQIGMTSGKIDGQRTSLGLLNSDLSKLNGKNFSYTVTERRRDERIVGDGVSSPNAKLQAIGRLRGGKKAIGTSYARGGTTLVGENGPELVNMPRGAQVFPSFRSRQMAQGGSDGGTHIEVHGSVILQNAEAVDAFFKQTDQAQRFARMGMAS